MCNVLTICAYVYVSVKQNAIFHLMWTLTLYCIVKKPTYFFVKHRALLFPRLTVCRAPCRERPNTYSATVSKLWRWGWTEGGRGGKQGLLMRDWVAVDTWHFCLPVRYSCPRSHLFDSKSKTDTPSVWSVPAQLCRIGERGSKWKGCFPSLWSESSQVNSMTFNDLAIY